LCAIWLARWQPVEHGVERVGRLACAIGLSHAKGLLIALPGHGLLSDPVVDHGALGDAPLAATLFEAVHIAAHQGVFAQAALRIAVHLQRMEVRLDPSDIAAQVDQDVREHVDAARGVLELVQGPVNEADGRALIRAVSVGGIGPVDRAQTGLVDPVDAPAIAVQAVSNGLAVEQVLQTLRCCGQIGGGLGHEISWLVGLARFSAFG
jgi:hypothetical protein